MLDSPSTILGVYIDLPLLQRLMFKAMLELDFKLCIELSIEIPDQAPPVSDVD